MIKFQSLEIRENLEATKAFYQRFIKPDSESCDCENCRNFRTFKGKLYSDSILTFLTGLGINPHIEFELGAFDVPSESRIYYHFNHYFYGEIITNNVQEVTSIQQEFPFSVDLSFKKIEGDLIQIATSARLPWISKIPKLPPLNYTVSELGNGTVNIKFDKNDRLEPIQLSLFTSEKVFDVPARQFMGYGLLEVNRNQFPSLKYVRIQYGPSSDRKSVYIKI